MSPAAVRDVKTLDGMIAGGDRAIFLFRWFIVLAAGLTVQSAIVCWAEPHWTSYLNLFLQPIAGAFQASLLVRARHRIRKIQTLRRDIMRFDAAPTLSAAILYNDQILAACDDLNDGAMPRRQTEKDHEQH